MLMGQRDHPERLGDRNNSHLQAYTFGVWGSRS